MTTETTDTIRRVVLYAVDGVWRWKALGRNWRTVDRAPRTYATPGKARMAARKRYPDVEIVQA